MFSVIRPQHGVVIACGATPFEGMCALDQSSDLRKSQGIAVPPERDHSAGIRLETIGPDRIREVVDIHVRSFPDSATTLLGRRAICRYYEWLFVGPHEAHYLGALARDRLEGYCFCGHFRGALHGFLSRNRAFLAGFLAVRPWLFFRPAIRAALWTSACSLARGTAKRPAHTREPRRFGILALAVAPDCRRAGIGRRLMEWAETIASRAGYENMGLTVNPKNESAIQFYERLGWNRVGQTSTWQGEMIKSLSRHTRGQETGIGTICSAPPPGITCATFRYNATVTESAGCASAPRPRLLFVGSFMSTDRLERYPSGDLAKRLIHSGWRVLLSSRKTNRLARLSDISWTIVKQRTDYDIAIVDVFSGLAFFWAEAATTLLRELGKPFVLVLHGGNLPAFTRRWPGRTRRMLSGATAIFTPSRYLCEALRPFRADIHVVPNAIDLAGYPFRLRRQPQPALVWLRAFHAIYNPALVPRVVAELSSDFPAVSCTMIGPDKGDDSLERVRAEMRRLNLGERIRLTGPLDKSQVGRGLNTGDIFVNTTNVDNTPVSVVEAMACGLCIVTTNVGGIPFLVTEGDTGLLVPPDDAPAMAAAIRRILTQPDLAERLSRNSRAQAAQFAWPAVLPRYETLLANILVRAAGTPQLSVQFS